MAPIDVPPGGLVRRWLMPRGNRPLGGRFRGPAPGPRTTGLHWYAFQPCERKVNTAGSGDSLFPISPVPDLPPICPPNLPRPDLAADLAVFVRLRAPSPNPPRTPNSLILKGSTSVNPYACVLGDPAMLLIMWRLSAAYRFN